MHERVKTPANASPELYQDGPTAEQHERFLRLTPEQRFHWLTDMLKLLHDMATPEARKAWRNSKAKTVTRADGQ